MKKKLLSIVGVIGFVVLFTFGYNQAFGPKAVEGEKKVTIEIAAEEREIDAAFTYHTDHEFLYALLEEKAEELGASFETYDFGTMVTGMMDYEAKTKEKEYFHMTINSVDATTGPEEIPLKDQGTYRFELRNY